MTHYCKTCNKEIHPKRVALGYKTTCLEHSTAAKCVGFVVPEGETGFTIDIVKDPQVAQNMERLMGARGQMSL